MSSSRKRLIASPGYRKQGSIRWSRNTDNCLETSCSSGMSSTQTLPVSDRPRIRCTGTLSYTLSSSDTMTGLLSLTTSAKTSMAILSEPSRTKHSPCSMTGRGWRGTRRSSTRRYTTRYYLKSILLSGVEKKNLFVIILNMLSVPIDLLSDTLSYYPAALL